MNLYISGLGQDSHRFRADGTSGLTLGGLFFEHLPALAGNSDADVLLHALCNAISSVTGQPVLGARADALCQQGIRDSQAYLDLACRDLRAQPEKWQVLHIAFSLEGARPRIEPIRSAICAHVAQLMQIPERAVALTATSGEGLTGPGRGEGIACFCLISLAGETAED